MSVKTLAKTNTRMVVHPGFAERMAMAADNSTAVPPPNYGRQTWIAEQFRSRHGRKIAVETVRKWFAGETKPRADAMRILAELMGVDEAWLSLGTSSALSNKEQRLRNATADGAVNLVAGMIHMAGSTPAFPEPGDKRAADGKVDLYAIIKGGQYSLHVATGTDKQGGWKVAVPAGALDCIVIAVLPYGEFCFHILELDPDALNEFGERKSGAIVVEIDDDLKTGEHQWRRIRSFSERL